MHFDPTRLFNVSNPTGFLVRNQRLQDLRHYKLELNKTCQFAVAQRLALKKGAPEHVAGLLLLDRWEAVMNKRNGRVDISSRGCFGRLDMQGYIVRESMRCERGLAPEILRFWC